MVHFKPTAHAVLFARLGIIVLALFATSDAVARGADEPSENDAADLARTVQDIFDVKCAECHSPRAKKVEKFNTILDVAGMIKDKKRGLLTPGSLDDSEIWLSIDDDTMPTKKAKAGPMTKQQKEVVKQWVLAGAPAFPGEASAPPPPFKTRVVMLLGHFHPLLVHFPISLLVAAAMAEALYLWRRQPWLPGTVRLCTLIGTLGAVVSGGLGWIDWIHHPPNHALPLHQWLGTAAVVWAIPLAIISEHGFRRGGEPQPRLLFRILLFVGVVLTGVAAHIGGEVVYGPDFLSL